MLYLSNSLTVWDLMEMCAYLQIMLRLTRGAVASELDSVDAPTNPVYNRK